MAFRNVPSGVKLIAVAFVQAAPAFASPTVLHWNNWRLEYEVGSVADGLSLLNVRYQDKLILGKASVPVIQAFYDNNVCGPFVSRLGRTNLAAITWAGNATIVAREFLVSGQAWYELGVVAKLGNYEIYQVWYLREDGVLDAHLFSKGLQCNANHVQYPYWRFDVDLAGSTYDQIRYMQGGAWHVLTNETDVDTAIADTHQWQVRDLITGDYLNISPAGTGGNVLPFGVSSAEHANNRILVRAYRRNEDKGWIYGAGSEEPHHNDEPIDGQNLVVWYKGHIPHTAAEAGGVWHGTGVRLNLGIDSARDVNHIPAIVSPGSQAHRVGSDANLVVDASDPDGDVLSFSAAGLPPDLMINETTGHINGTLAASAEGTHTVTLGVSDGQSSATTSFVWRVAAGAKQMQRFDFESGLDAWVVNPDGKDTATAGRWEVARLTSATNESSVFQGANCAKGRQCLVTGARLGRTAGAYDVDDGRTAVRSPSINLTAMRNPRLTFSYSFSHDSSASSLDYFRVRIAGDTTTTVFERRGSGRSRSGAWSNVLVDLRPYSGRNISLLMEAADNGSPSLIEAAVDNVVIEGD